MDAIDRPRQNRIEGPLCHPDDPGFHATLKVLNRLLVRVDKILWGKNDHEERREAKQEARCRMWIAWNFQHHIFSPPYDKPSPKVISWLTRLARYTAFEIGRKKCRWKSQLGHSSALFEQATLKEPTQIQAAILREVRSRLSTDLRKFQEALQRNNGNLAATAKELGIPIHTAVKLKILLEKLAN